MTKTDLKEIFRTHNGEPTNFDTMITEDNCIEAMKQAVNEAIQEIIIATKGTSFTTDNNDGTINYTSDILEIAERLKVK